MGAMVSRIRGTLAFLCYVINTIFWVTPIFAVSFFKLIPLSFTRTACTYFLDFCASAWIRCNGHIEDTLHPVAIEISGEPQLSPKQWYMVIANHQSWVDILVLQRVLNGKIPFLKFFLKQQLIFVPVLGLAWWALDFPFMRRYSQSQLRNNPKLRGKDIEITRKACAKFKSKPVSVMNFVEGTRFRADKHQQQQSPFTHLLKPKAGGMAFALSAMGEHIHQLVNVSIYYPNKIPTYWEFISGQVDTIKVHIELSQIDESLRGDYIKDRDFKITFQNQLNKMWQQKDQVMTELAKTDKNSKED